MSNTRDHRKFVNNDDWEQHKRGADHDYYRKRNPDGTWKRTKISHGYKDYGKGLFDHILKEQLKVSRKEFNEKL